MSKWVDHLHALIIGQIYKNKGIIGIKAEKVFKVPKGPSLKEKQVGNLLDTIWKNIGPESQP